MSGFGDQFDQDVDPAAEFLAREQDELAGLEDELKPAAIPVALINGDDPTNSASSFEMVEGFDHEGHEPIKQEDDEYLFESNPFSNDAHLRPDNGDFRGGVKKTDEVRIRGNTSTEFNTLIQKIILQGQFDTASPSPPPKFREEPEKIRIWREEQVKRLETKDEEEEKKKLELREIARRELEDWYTNHEDTITKTKTANRNAEKQFVSEDDDIVPGTEWERIAKLCDFNPKAKQGNKDVSRMRSMILQMKQTPVALNKA